MKASDVFVKCLEIEGVTRIFGVPGEENADFMMSLTDSDQIQFILTRHEQGAAFMAAGYSRASGKVGVCLVTSGPGGCTVTKKSLIVKLAGSQSKVSSTPLKPKRDSGSPGACGNRASIAQFGGSLARI